MLVDFFWLPANEWVASWLRRNTCTAYYWAANSFIENVTVLKNGW